jgi:hypothetical protein
MESTRKKPYEKPELFTHEPLRDITAKDSGCPSDQACKNANENAAFLRP